MAFSISVLGFKLSLILHSFVNPCTQLHKYSILPPLPLQLYLPSSSHFFLGCADSDHTNAVWSSKDNLSPPVSLHLKQQTLPPGSSLYSKTAGTHTFKKLRGPARCRECDTYVYFHGQECEIVSLYVLVSVCVWVCV